MAATVTEGLSNILNVQLTPNFRFYQYTVDMSDKNGKLIDSRSLRARLFFTYFMDPNEGYMAKVLKLSPTEIKDLTRTIFFEGSFFFAGRPIPGLEQFPTNITGSLGTLIKGGESVIIVDARSYSTPTELLSNQPPPAAAAAAPDHTQLCMDRRCSGCTKAFTDLPALIAHCSITGHAPEYQLNTDAGPAHAQLLLSYCNTALKHALQERMLRWGRSYVEPNKGKELTDKSGRGLGVELYRAYNCDINILKPGNQRPTLALTIDIGAKLIRTKGLLHHIYEDREPKPGLTVDVGKQNRFKQEIIGEIIICTYDKKCYTVTDLLFDKTPASHMIEGKGISHDEYFKTIRNIQLKYPTMAPMVAVMGRQKQTIYFPAELVCINELDNAVKSKLPLVASYTPKDRMDAIEEIKRYFIPGAQKTKGVGGGLLPALGIIIQPQLIKVAVEVLPLPYIVAAGITVPPDKGASWAPMLVKANYNVNPRQAVTLNVVLVHHRSIRNHIAVFSRIRDFVNRMNATYRFPDKPLSLIEVGDNQAHWGAVERHFSGKQPPNLFLVDLCRPVRGQALDLAYPVVKHILAKAGYLSQFVNFQTYNHDQPSDMHKSDTILGNVARQILSKCGYRVWWINIPRSIPLPAIFVGIDVFHAPRKYDSKLKQRVAKESVVAIVVQVVRSHDPKANASVEIYSKTFRRAGGLEMNVGPNLKTTLEEALRVLKVNPLSCVVWRDGVSDDMVNPVSKDEISNIRKAFASSRIIGAPSDKPPPAVAVAYMVVQKRITTKLFTTNAQALPCGSLVTSLQALEHSTFYINGTAPRFSTPKPARFIIVLMDPAFGPKKKTLAELSWALCHDYPNWSGPIKLPSVTQYSHVLAELVGSFPDNGDSIDAAAYANKLYFI